MKNSIYLIIILVLMACNNTKDDKQLLVDKVMVVHDEVMPLMDTLMELQNKLDSLAKADVSQQNGADSLKAKLKKADDAMMDWMADFDSDFLNQKHTPQQVEDYYQSQLQKIQIVQKQTNASIAEAKARLGMK